MTNVFAASECPQPEAGETLITRSITFRNSTFGGLKSFIREYGHKTGKHLTNAAAVDLLVRAQLLVNLNRNALGQMLDLSTVSASIALDAVVDKEGDVFEPVRTRAIPLEVSQRVRSGAPAFSFEVRKSKIIAVTNAGEGAKL